MKYVYVINETGTNKYKIGKAKNTKERLANLQVGNSVILKLITSFKTYNYTLLEKTLHKEFEENNVIGEWFTFDENELSNVLTVANNLCIEINNKKSANVLKLQHERISKHNNKSTKPFVCDKCDKDFITKIRYNKHANKKNPCNENKLQCKCGLILTSRTTIWRHNKICDKVSIFKNKDLTELQLPRNNTHSVKNEKLPQEKKLSTVNEVLQITKQIESFDKDKIDLYNRILDIISA